MSEHSIKGGETVVPMPALALSLRRLGARIDSDRSNLVLFACLFAIALLPVVATPIPAMVDYVNHLARMYLLAADGTADASPFYRVHWAFYPNLAMDLVVPKMARFASVETATRLFLLLSQILVVTGAVAIEHVVKRRFAFAGYVALMMLYSVPFAWGFVNFEFAIGLALWGIAFWLALRRRHAAFRLAVHTVVVLLLFVSHLFALGLYGIALGLHELWAARVERTPLSRLAGVVVMLAAPVLVLAAIMHASNGAVGQAGNIWFFAMKPFWPLAVLNGYSIVLSAVCSTLLACVSYTLVRRGAMRFEASGAWLLAGFGGLYLVIPSRMLDTAFVDLRIIVAAALIVPAFMRVTPPSRAWRLGLMGLMAGTVLVNTADALIIGRSYGATYQAMIDSFGRFEKGSRVLVAQSGPEADPPLRDLAAYPIYHAPTLAVHYAAAFVPTLYATPGKQPIELTEKAGRLASSCTGPVPLDLLAHIATDGATAATPAFIRSWMRDFDYLYVVGPPVRDPLPAVLTPLQIDPRFTLYAIARKRQG